MCRGALLTTGRRLEGGDPADVGAGQTAQGENIGDTPRLWPQVEQFELQWQRPDACHVVIQSDHECLQPVTRGGWHFGQDRRDRAPNIQDAHQLIDIDADPADHFGYTTLREASHELDLAEPKMCVHQPQCDSQIAVAVRLHKWHLMPVPADQHRLIER